MAKAVGITGGIASGKSVVAKIIEILGYPVYYSDNRAKEIMNEDFSIREGLRLLFGDSVYIQNQLNRPFLAEQIFNSPVNREAVNQLVHPVVRNDFENWLANQNSVMAFQESALLFETNQYKRFDEIILVVSPTEIRVKRLIARDGISSEEAKKRINTQLSDDDKRKLTQWVIENNDKDFLTTQVLETINNLKRKLDIESV